MNERGLDHPTIHRPENQGFVQGGVGFGQCADEKGTEFKKKKGKVYE